MDYPYHGNPYILNRVGAGVERSGVGTLASPLVGALDSSLGDASVPTL